MFTAHPIAKQILVLTSYPLAQLTDYLKHNLFPYLPRTLQNNWLLCFTAYPISPLILMLSAYPLAQLTEYWIYSISYTSTSYCTTYYHSWPKLWHYTHSISYADVSDIDAEDGVLDIYKLFADTWNWFQCLPIHCKFFYTSKQHNLCVPMYRAFMKIQRYYGWYWYMHEGLLV